jgi:hypothetical protein
MEFNGRVLSLSYRWTTRNQPRNENEYFGSAEKYLEVTEKVRKIGNAVEPVTT